MTPQPASRMPDPQASAPASAAAEIKLQEAHDRLKATLEALPDLLFVLDRDGRIYDYHAPSTDRLYVPPDQFLGRKMVELLPEPAGGIIARALQDAVAHGHHYGSVYPLPTPGGPKWFEISIAAQGDPQSPEGRLVAIVRDITERRAAEDILRQSEQRVRQIIDLVPHFIFAKDAQGRFILANQALADAYGTTVGQLIGKTDAHFDGAEEEVRHFREDDLAVLASGRPLVVPEETITDSQGHQRILATTKIPFTCPDIPLPAVLGVAVDITERKRAEDALRLFKESVENASDAVGMSTPEGKHYYQNRAFDKLFGAVGENPPDTLYADSAVGHEVFRTIMAGGHWTGEVQMHARDGRILDVFLRAYANQDENGRITALLGIHTDITERKRAEEALRESEQRLTQIARQSRMIAWELDPEGRYTFIGPVAEEVLGYRPDEIVGKFHHYDLHPEEGREAFTAEVTEFMRQQIHVVNYENAIQTKTGEIVWVSTHAEPLLNPDGTLRGYRGSDLDITERKRAELALRESEKKYREFHETMRDAFCLVDMHGQIVEVNPAFLVLTGYSEQELRTLTYLDLTPAKWHVAEARIVAEQVLPRGYSDVYQKEYIRADGTPVPIEMRTTLLRNEAGHPTGMWATIRDITSRLRIERSLKQATAELDRRVKARTAELETSREALSKSEEQFRQMAESIQEVFWLIDTRSQKTLYVSPAFERLWGRPRDQLAPDVSKHADMIHPEDRQRCLTALARAVETGDLPPIEYRIQRPDGTLRWIEDHAWGIRDAHGHIIRLAGVMRDITDRRRLEAELLKAAEAERQRIGRDLHDSLGQTLTGIGYLAEALHETLAQQSHPETPEAAKLAHLIEDAAAKAHAMARSMLMVDLKRSGLPTVLQELAFRAQEMLGADCRYDGPEDVGWIDPEAAGQLYRIAQEAVTNAVKHAKGTGIEIRLFEEPDGLRLSVCDSGQGLPDSPSATGMGLDIMRYRAGLIGATLRIESTPDQGTTVNCFLSRSPTPPESVPCPPLPPTGTPNNAS